MLELGCNRMGRADDETAIQPKLYKLVGSAPFVGANGIIEEVVVNTNGCEPRIGRRCRFQGFPPSATPFCVTFSVAFRLVAHPNLALGHGIMVDALGLEPRTR